MLQNFNRPKPIAWFFFLLAFGMTVGFGSWQVVRLQWKQGLIADLAAANAQAPLTTLPERADALAPLQFRKVSLRGTWMEGTEFHITPRYLHDQFGYHIITPLKLADGRVLLVNRGWVPGKYKRPESRPESAVHGNITVTGLLRVDRDRGYFTPPNQPEKNIWFARDIDAMASSAKLENTIPAMVDSVDEAAANARDIKHLPIPSDGVIRLRNDHLSYIITWYGIATGILVIFVTYHRKKRERRA